MRLSPTAYTDRDQHDAPLAVFRSVVIRTTIRCAVAIRRCDDNDDNNADAPTPRVFAPETAESVTVERYEYDPYGERTVYISPGVNDPDCHAPTMLPQRVKVGGIDQPYGICEFGFQGRPHCELTGGIDHRTRMWNIWLKQWQQTDRSGYVDGMNNRAGHHVLWGGLDPLGSEAIPGLTTNIPDNDPAQTPWSTENQVFLNGVTVITRFDIACECVKCDNNCYRIECGISMDMYIRLQQGIKDFKGTMGHEQMHVGSLLQETKSIIEGCGLRDGKCVYKTLDACKAEAQKRKARAHLNMVVVSLLEAQHANAGSPWPDHKGFPVDKWGEEVPATGVPFNQEDVFRDLKEQLADKQIEVQGQMTTIKDLLKLARRNPGTSKEQMRSLVLAAVRKALPPGALCIGD